MLHRKRKFTLVCIGPGAIALYLIPYLPHSDDRDLKYENHIKVKVSRGHVAIGAVGIRNLSVLLYNQTHNNENILMQ